MIKATQSIIIKIIVIMLIFAIGFMPISNANSLDNIFQQGSEFIEQGKDGQVVENANGDKVTITNEAVMKQAVNQVYNVLFALGVALSVIIGAILGIKLMWGSIEQQAKVKEMLVPYCVGCLVIFGAFGIWRICITILLQI